MNTHYKNDDERVVALKKVQRVSFFLLIVVLSMMAWFAYKTFTL